MVNFKFSSGAIAPGSDVVISIRTTFEGKGDGSLTVFEIPNRVHTAGGK